jgi:hypothetical protein
LPIVVEQGTTVEESQILASFVRPLSNNELRCAGSLPQDHIPGLLASPERTQRFTGVKLARLRGEPEYASLIERVTLHPEEDLYVRLEGTVYLTRVSGQSTQALIGPYLASQDEQIQLEAVVALAESATTEAVEILASILDRDNAPFFLRSAAAWALGRIGTERAIDRLVIAFSDVDRAIREEALEAIDSLGEPALNQLIPGLVGDDQSIAAGAAEAIRRQALLPPETIQEIICEVEADARQLWAVWLLGHLPLKSEYVKTAIAELQDSRPEAHYAITVLWTFVESWIARNWELTPTAKDKNR